MRLGTIKFISPLGKKINGFETNFPGKLIVYYRAESSAIFHDKDKQISALKSCGLKSSYGHLRIELNEGKSLGQLTDTAHCLNSRKNMV